MEQHPTLPVARSDNASYEPRATGSSPAFILEVKRDAPLRRGGRTGVDVFLLLSLSKGLLIFERGAKIPVTQIKKCIKRYDTDSGDY